MRTNDVACYYECDDTFTGALSHVSIAYIEHLHTMSVALDILAGEERHTIYIPHSSVPQIVQAFSASYYSIADTIKQMEEEQDGK
jgi:hypothetical protein